MYHKTTPSLQVCLYIVDFGSQHSDDTKKINLKSCITYKTKVMHFTNLCQMIFHLSDTMCKVYMYFQKKKLSSANFKTRT